MGYALPWERGAEGAIADRLAADAARRAVEGSLPPGALVTEVGLAEQAGVSRTPAREAMLRLASWGLVRLVPKKGAIVTAETAQDRRDLLDVRTMLEATAAEQLSRDPAGPAALRGDLATVLERQRSAVGSGDALGFASADYAFHVRVIESMRNEVVADIVSRLGPRLARMTYTVASEQPEALARLLAEHEDLARLLEAGDAAGFATRVRAHVEAGHELHRTHR